VQTNDVGTSDLSGPAQSGVNVAIGNRALKGSVWMIGATGAAKAFGFACQLALAWFLTKEDYGVYAIAISLSVFLSVLRDGGLPQVLEQKGDRFDSFAGAVFWMMLAMNCGTGLVLALIAKPAARFYGIADLAGVVMLFAVTIPLSVVPSVLSARLALDLKFRELGLVQVVSAMARNGLLLFFAWAGFGARSFLLPVLVTSVTDSLLLWTVARCSPWNMAPQFHLWRELFAGGRWVLLGTFSIAVGNNGAYFILGKLLPADIVGTYFFAYQLVVQLGVLLSDNVYQILVGSFARMRGELSRLRSAVPPALGMIVLVGAAASLMIGAIYEPLEQVLWHGKWAGAGPGIQILAVLWPVTAGASVLRALQMATGHFRQWGIVTLLGAFASVLGAGAGALWGGSAASTAVGFGLGAVFGSALNAAIALPHIGIRPVGAALPILKPWVIIVIAAACARYISMRFEVALVETAVAGTCFAVFSFLGLRLFATDSLRVVERSLRRIIRPTAPASEEIST
jgi:O-antigen/teichoic acid export membrane protein